MPIVGADLIWRYSTGGGSSQGDTDPSTAAGSLGTFMATTPIIDKSLWNLFREITQAEAAAGITLYKCAFVLNVHATDTLLDAKAWIASQRPGGGTITIGLDPAGVTAKASGSDQAATIASEAAAPTGVTFSAPTTKASGLSIGDIAAANCAAVWVRLIIPAGSRAMLPDDGILAVGGKPQP